MNGRILAEVATCLRLDEEDVARLALHFTSGHNALAHEEAARTLANDAAASARLSSVRQIIINAIGGPLSFSRRTGTK